MQFINVDNTQSEIQSAQINPTAFVVGIDGKHNSYKAFLKAVSDINAIDVLHVVYFLPIKTQEVEVIVENSRNSFVFDETTEESPKSQDKSKIENMFKDYDKHCKESGKNCKFWANEYIGGENAHKRIGFALCTFAKTTKSQMIYLGSSDKSGWEDLFDQSVGHHLLSCPCDISIVNN